MIGTLTMGMKTPTNRTIAPIIPMVSRAPNFPASCGDWKVRAVGAGRGASEDGSRDASASACAGRLRSGTSIVSLQVGQSINWLANSSGASTDWLQEGQLNRIALMFFYAERQS
jgi:hypothetical protein